MTFLTLRLWMRRNAVDEDGRVWYEECISAKFIRHVEEAVKGAVKNVNWDRPSFHDRVRRSRPCPRWWSLLRPDKQSTVPSSLPARPIAADAQGRKRGRETSSTEAAVIAAVTAETVMVETAALERPRKRVLLDLSEDEDEEEAPSAAGEEEVEEEAAAEAPGVEAIIQDAADPEELVAEEVVEEVAEDTNAGCQRSASY
ncbi:unnamed protein product [Prunus armeniaca]